MKLEDLRHREDEVRATLADVREKLDAAVATIERAERARERASAHGKSEGAYRDIAKEHAAELEAQVAAARLASEQRERLRREETRLVLELERIRVGMEELGVRRSVLPLLEGIPAASPCSVRWDEMSGNGDARTCPHCKLTVLNLAMTDAARAQELLAACGPDLALHRRADGTILARDCPTGVARKRFFRVAPFAIVALMAVVVSAALYTARAERTLVATPFGSTRTSPPLHGAPSLHVLDDSTGLGGHHQADIELTRTGDTFDAKLTCVGSHGESSRTTKVPAATVDAFLDVVASHKGSAANASCFHTDDYPRMTVTVGVTPMVTLAVFDCSRQWHLNGLALDDIPHDAGPLFESYHVDINAAYRAILAAAGERQCYDEADTQPIVPRVVSGRHF